jgi:hypothetical protein
MTEDRPDLAMATRSVNKSISVRVSTAVAFDIEKVQQVQRDVLGRLGCQACCSGFNIGFIEETEFVADSELNVRGASEVG